ncbi:MAG: hypothetical protein R3F30_14520 [Planctomycetota bacterium]
MIFTADDGVTGTELWISDGTPKGTRLLKDVNPGAGSGHLPQLQLRRGERPDQGRLPGVRPDQRQRVVGHRRLDGRHHPPADIVPGTADGAYYFGCTDAAPPASTCPAPRGPPSRSGSTAPRPALPFATSVGTGYPYYLEADGTGRVFFPGNDLGGLTGREPCVTDGTVTGTLAFDIFPGSGPGYGSYMTCLAKGTCVFYGGDGKLGYEPWVTDGTAAGTRMIKDIHALPAPMTANDDVQYVVPLFDRVLFTADDGVNGQELWASDGTAAGTNMVLDLNPGSGSGYCYYKCRLGDAVLFTGYHPSSGYELWITDGTKAGTRLLKDIYANGNSYPSFLTRIGDQVFFSAYSGPAGYELWATDGTTAGTRMVADIYPGTGSSNPRYFHELAGKACFYAFDGTRGFELWTSDGTAAGTKLVKDIDPGGPSSYPSYFTELNGKLYFQATTTATGYELFETDGTSAGTKLVKDIYPGTGSGSPAYKCTQNGKLWFYATDGINGYQLWESDGTATNTYMALQAPFDLIPTYITAVGSRRIYFTGNTATSGNELNILDTTTTPYRTWMVDIFKGPNNSTPYNFTGNDYRFAVMDGSAWFRANASAFTDFQLFRSPNGGTAQAIGRRSGTTSLGVTDPRINQVMKITGRTSVANAAQLLFLGAPAGRPAALLGGFLYFDLLQPFSVIAAVGGTSMSLSYTVPNDTGLVGGRVVLQSLGIDAARFPAGTELSNGVHLVIGNTW